MTLHRQQLKAALLREMSRSRPDWHKVCVLRMALCGPKRPSGRGFSD